MLDISRPTTLIVRKRKQKKLNILRFIHSFIQSWRWKQLLKRPTLFHFQLKPVVFAWYTLLSKIRKGKHTYSTVSKPSLISKRPQTVQKVSLLQSSKESMNKENESNKSRCPAQKVPGAAFNDGRRTIALTISQPFFGKRLLSVAEKRQDVGSFTPQHKSLGGFSVQSTR